MKIRQSVVAHFEQSEQSATVASIAYERRQRELWAAEAVMDDEEEFIQQLLLFSPEEREYVLADLREIAAQSRRARFTLVP